MFNIPILRATALASLRGEDPVQYLMCNGKMSHEVAHHELSEIVYAHNKNMTLDEMLQARKYSNIGELINVYLNGKTLEAAGEEFGD